MNIINDYLLNPSQRVYWLYLLTAGIIVLAYGAFIYYASGKILITKDNIKNYWLHPSAKLDYIYFILNSLLKIVIIAPLVISAKTIAEWIFYYLMKINPDMMFNINLSTSIVVAIYSISLFLVSDFTRYWLHRWLHTVPFLWAFHKVHHSCEVLNPISFYRVHPVENLLFGLRYSLSTGIVTGICLWLFGSQLDIWTIFGSNAFVVIFLLLGANLRHSQIYLYYPKWLEKLFISPAQHQLHHSPRYVTKNYGGYLGIWDYIFGSWQSGKDAIKPTRYGFSKTMSKPYQSLSGLILEPFRDIFKTWKKHYEKNNKKQQLKS